MGSGYWKHESIMIHKINTFYWTALIGHLSSIVIYFHFYIKIYVYIFIYVALYFGETTPVWHHNGLFYHEVNQSFAW